MTVNGDALVFQFHSGGMDIRDLKTNVVDPLTVLVKKFALQVFS